MARDGLLPPALAKTHPRFKTPHLATILTGLFVGAESALASLEEMADLCNIGTLSAFVIVSAGVLVLRRREPAPRPACAFCSLACGFGGRGRPWDQPGRRNRQRRSCGPEEST